MSRIVKFVRMRPAERGLLLHAWREVAIMRLACSILPYPRVRALVQKHGARVSGISAMRPDRDRIARAVGLTSGYVPGGRNCLVRALATEAILLQNGYDCDLKIGAIRTSDGGLRAHAWLECDGRAIIGDFELSRYVTMEATRATGSL